MATKLYVSGLRATLNTTHRYATRYQAALSTNLTTEQYACLQAVIAAVASCLALLGKDPIS